MSGYRDAFPILQVADVGRSLGFYRDLMGYRVTYAFPSPDAPVFVSLEIDGGKLGLGGAEGPVASASTALWHSADDVDAAVARRSRAGVRVVSEPAGAPMWMV